MPDAASAPRPPPLCRGEGLCFSPAPGLPQTPLDLEIRPGLTLVLGGERSGKTTVLRWLAGQDAPAGGRLLRQAVTVCWPAPLDTACDTQTVTAWLAHAAQRWPAWRADHAAAAMAALSIGPHADKTLAMLSSGTRRKLGLVEALASGAELTLLDGPFAALDMPSRRWLVDLLDAAAGQASRAWVVADHAWPSGLTADARIAVVDLGDGLD